MSFTIDEVREVFTADVSRLIGQIQAAADALLARPGELPRAEVGGRPAFELLGELGHALCGTTSLVGAESLSESAKQLEEAARLGQESLRLLEAHTTRARRIAQLCAEGAVQMRQMLSLELAKQRAQAVDVSRAWRRQAGDATALPAPPAPEPPPELPPAEEFEFGLDDESSATPTAHPLLAEDDGPHEEFAFGESVISTEPAGFEDELLGVFREEAKSVLQTLAEKLAELRRDPRDLAVASDLERLYHTLKGAAATVGLRDVSAAAAAIDDRLNDLIETGASSSTAFIDDVYADTNAMLAMAGLPALAVPAPDPASAAVGEAHPLFVEECRELHGQATVITRVLSAAPFAEQERLRGELARLFHRLKGSALIVREKDLGAAAERVQRLLEEAEPERSGAELAHEAGEALTRLEFFLAGAVPSELGPAPGLARPTDEEDQPRPREAVQVEGDGELWEAFQLEGNEILEGLEREVLALEDSAQPKTSLETIMRLVHTLKGVVNTVGLAPTGKLLHAAEDFLEALMAAPILPPMRKVATLLLEVRDAVRRNFKQARDGSVEVFLPRIAARIGRLLGEKTPPASSFVVSREEGASIHSLDSARSRRSVHSAPSGPGRSREGAYEDGMERKFIRVATERLDNLMNLAGELVVSRSRLLARAASLRDIQRELGRGSRRLLESVETFREEHEFANLDGKRMRRGAALRTVQRRATAGATAFASFGELELDQYEDIHVLSRTLTEITGDVDEMNGQLARGLSSLTDDSDVFDKLISGIQSEVTRARMVPLDVLFTRLKFPVRDAAGREGKDVRVATVGADVNLDKTIADALLQPMLHLVRNSVVHGIEAPAAREKRGKPPGGTITLTARQQAGQIGIEVTDDGGGLDLHALRTRGVAMGLIAADVPLTDPAVRELVFHPGLTTRASAGAVSGRGVGCDVVRRAVERLGGSIRVESEPGRNTTFLITLPVSLAITKALLVRARDRSYAIPLHFAERIVDAAESTFVESAGVRRVKIGDQLLPVSTFAHHFGDKEAAERGRAVLLLRVGDHRLALEVDAVVGQEEVVVKALGPFLAGHPLFAGVTVRGSGELVLILDVAGLIQSTQRAAQPRTKAAASPQRKPAEPAPSESSPPTVVPSVEAAALRVLFIDDSLSVRKFAEMTLKSLGADVTMAIDGVDGMNKIRNGTFDLVFTDLEMPRMHGFELIGELRFLPAYHDLPIIVVTSRSGQKHQQQARALGATDYLTKPFNAQMLDAALKRWARRPGERGAGTP